MSYLFKPEIEQDTLECRDYQAEAVEAVRNEFKKGVRRTLVVHPTGTGKGVCIAKLCRYTVDKGNRALVLAHRDELITESANVIERVGIVPGIEKAEAKARHAFDAQVVVASVASMQGNRLRSFPPDFFGLVIPDEAHHVPAPTWMNVLDYFKKARVVGFTATPARNDDARLDETFESIAHEYTILQAMKAPYPGPYLARFRFRREDIGVDLRDLKPGRKDFNPDDLAERIKPHVAKFANKIREHIGDRPTIVFTPTVPSATAFASAFANMGFAVDWVSGDDPDRSYKVGRYLSGESQIICCCDLLTEGFNVTHASAIVLCRPTNSWTLYVQMIGRGLRPHPNKDFCLILDFDWLTERYSLMRPSDLFARELGSSEAVRLLDDATGPGSSVDILDAIESTSAKARSSPAERRIIEVPAFARNVQSIRTEVYDPFEGTEAPSPSMRPAYSAKHDIPSENMIRFLESRGHKNASKFSKRYAGKLIGIYKAKEASTKEASSQREAV